MAKSSDNDRKINELSDNLTQKKKRVFQLFSFILLFNRNN
jgi:hypothetical protein